MTDSPHFLAITGPTATGKTALSLEVAARLDGEIISMDSRQVYRGMDIGTDKVSLRERARVPHHGLDTLDPDEFYSAGQFGRDARAWIREIRARGRVPLLAGGTGFFLRSLTHPLFPEPELDRDRLLALRSYLAGLPWMKLQEWVRVLDPDRSDAAIEGGTQRVTRALEVALLSGQPLSRWHDATRGSEEAPVPGVIVALELPREELHRRIDTRVDSMADAGFSEEVARLMEAGYGPEAPGMTGTGYREMSAYLRGDLELEAALKEMKQSTRQFARRQETWFRHQLPSALRLDALSPLEEQVVRVVTAWHEATGTPVIDEEATEGTAEE
ncbi:tRNA (adenosine(37)-N6)-dimethylallyltransferase MiaA [Gemmatimonadota bacterium]